MPGLVLFLLFGIGVQSADGKIPLYWGIAADGSVVICDDVGIIKGGCGKSYAPFPTGLFF